MVRILPIILLSLALCTCSRVTRVVQYDYDEHYAHFRASIDVYGGDVEFYTWSLTRALPDTSLWILNAHVNAEFLPNLVISLRDTAAYMQKRTYSYDEQGKVGVLKVTWSDTGRYLVWDSVARQTETINIVESSPLLVRGTFSSLTLSDGTTKIKLTNGDFLINY